MRRAVSTVLTEATVIGAISVLFYYILRRLGFKGLVNSFLIGFLLHLSFEYFPKRNLNEWWCKKTF